MKKNMLEFSYGTLVVRAVQKDGETWWVLKDVCDILELTSPHKVADRLDDDEKGRSLIPTLGGNQELTVVNESGLYNVILRSDKPEAKKFKRWVTHEVLPSIRKHGLYATPETTEAILNDPDFLITALTKLKSEREHSKRLEAKIKQDEPYTTTGKTIETVQRAIKVEEFARYVQNTYKGLGRNKLFRLLRDRKVFYQYGGITMPLQEYMNRGYFVVKESTYTHGGITNTRPTILITGKGQVWLAKKLSEWMENPSCAVCLYDSKKGGVA